MARIANTDNYIVASNRREVADADKTDLDRRRVAQQPPREINTVEEFRAECVKLWPIVTDDAIASIEDECLKRWERSQDAIWTRVVTAMRSMRQEIAKMEHTWLMLNKSHGQRLLLENTVLRTAIETTLGIEAKSKASDSQREAA